MQSYYLTIEDLEYSKSNAILLWSFIVLCCSFRSLHHRICGMQKTKEQQKHCVPMKKCHFKHHEERIFISRWTIASSWSCEEENWHVLVNSIFLSSASLGKGHLDTLFSNKTDRKSSTHNRVRATIPSPPQIKPESLNLLLSAFHLDHNLSGTPCANQSPLCSFFPPSLSLLRAPC